MSTILNGIGVGQVPVVAEVFQVEPAQTLPPFGKSQTDAATEQQILTVAIGRVSDHFSKLSHHSDSDAVEIFGALDSLLKDEALFETSVKFIEQGWSAASSFGLAVEEFCELLGEDPVFAERAADLLDISNRVQASIAGIETTLKLPQSGSFVIVANSLSPADTAQFNAAVVGVITATGGPTSHTAIICRSMGIPAIFGVENCASLENGTSVLLDPLADRIVVGGTVAEATQPLKFADTGRTSLIPVRANIGSLVDAEAAAAANSDGVGLLRTEFLYLNQKTAPSVDSQKELYRKLLQASPTGPVIVRTFDPELDKSIEFLPMPTSELARRYRVLELYPEILTRQLEALELARIESDREVWVMAPMIGSASEAEQFVKLARTIGSFRVGVMVELPELVAELPRLSGLVDFISVGTNDLSQYLFSANRTEGSNHAELSFWQPELIRSLAEIAKHCRVASIHSSVCGESASDPAFAVLLAGLGFDAVSVSTSQVERVRSALAAVTPDQASLLASAVLSANSSGQTKSAALATLSAF